MMQRQSKGMARGDKLAGAFRRWRQAKRIPIEIVCLAVGRSVSTVRSWERGESSPTIADVVVLERRWKGLLGHYRRYAVEG